jgi:MinD-like ATPase involved in chromosome partitioning or flagellar assembly
VSAGRPWAIVVGEDILGQALTSPDLDVSGPFPSIEEFHAAYARGELERGRRFALIVSDQIRPGFGVDLHALANLPEVVICCWTTPTSSWRRAAPPTLNGLRRAISQTLGLYGKEALSLVEGGDERIGTPRGSGLDDFFAKVTPRVEDHVPTPPSMPQQPSHEPDPVSDWSALDGLGSSDLAGFGTDDDLPPGFHQDVHVVEANVAKSRPGLQTSGALDAMLETLGAGGDNVLLPEPDQTWLGTAQPPVPPVTGKSSFTTPNADLIMGIPRSPIASAPVIAEPEPQRLGLVEPGRRSEARPVSTGMLLAVWSTKGGVGKTTIAANLAAALAGWTQFKVIATDIDDGAAGAFAVRLHIASERTIVDALSAPASPGGGLDRSHIEACLSPYDIPKTVGRGSLLVLPGPSEVMSSRSRAIFQPHLVGTLMDTLCAMAHIVVVDCPHGMGNGAFVEALLPRLRDGGLIVVVDNETATIRQMNGALHKLADIYNVDISKVGVVINQHVTSAGLSLDDVMHFLGDRGASPRLLGVVPDERNRFVGASDIGAVALADPTDFGSNMRVSFAHILEMLFGSGQVPWSVDPTNFKKKEGPKRGFFRKGR